MLPELPTFAQFFLNEEEEEEKLALEEEDSEEAWDEERIELFFLFLPELKLVVLLFAPVLPPLAEFGVTGVEEPEDVSLGLKDDEDFVVVLLLLEERDLSVRPEAREGTKEEEEDEDKWAEGICGDEDTCRACVVP